MPQELDLLAESNFRELADLIPDPQNANKGTARGADALERSLREFGAGRAVLIDSQGRIIAGNKTVEQAKRLNLPLRVIKTDGTHLIAIQRDDLDLARDAHARALGVADNRVGELNLEWDVEMLKALHAGGVDLSAFWNEEEFAALFEEDKQRGKDDAAIEPADTDIVPGDLFLLNQHRLLCGDATGPDDVAQALGDLRPRLMVTDPPYGVQYDPGWRHRLRRSQRTAVGAVMNDDRADWRTAWELFAGDIAYVWHAALKAPIVAASLEAAHFVLRSEIIWVKQHFAMGRGNYHWRHEPALYAVRHGARDVWKGDRSQNTVWEVANLNPMGGGRDVENPETAHGTQKPVKLYEIPLVNHTVRGEALYDPFCGTGTAIIAAEKLGRRCVALDLDPRYVQVAVTRWEQYTGQRAQRIAAADRRAS